jgi:putative ABC transport system permease protein
MTRMLQRVLFVLLAAVAFVLLIASANMANLMLARGVSRQRELYVCAALGATRWRLARRVMLESLAICTAGGVLGVAVGVLGLRGLIAIIPPEHARFLPGFERLEVDGAVLAVTSVVVIAVSLLVSALPAVRAGRATMLDSAMRRGGRGVAGSGHRVRGALVAAEVGLAIMLLVGAGLMVRTFAFLSNRGTGIDASRSVLASVTLPALRYTDATAQRAFFRDALTGLRALPGVSVAGATSIIPMCQCNSTTSFQIDGAAPFAQGEEPDVGERVVTPGYFEALSLSMTQGRVFTDADRDGATRVVIVNSALASRYFPSGAIGKRITFGDSIQYQVVGVAADIRHDGHHLWRQHSIPGRRRRRRHSARWPRGRSEAGALSPVRAEPAIGAHVRRARRKWKPGRRDAVGAQGRQRPRFRAARL